MPGSTNQAHNVQTYELVLSHADIIGMMNQISLAGGGLTNDQELEVAIRRVTGAEVIVQDGFDSNDELVLRFRATVDTPGSTTFSGVEIIP